MTKALSSSVSRQLDQAIARGEVDLANPPPDLTGLQDTVWTLRSAELELATRADAWVDFNSVIAKLRSGNDDIRMAQRLSSVRVARMQRRIRLRIFWRKWRTTIFVLLMILAIGGLIFMFRETLLEWVLAPRDLFKPNQDAATPASGTSAPAAPSVPSSGGKP